ncbi:histidine phosphatase family protein [Roseateles sp. DAIF2]|uniref:histidine phosphatase family protein n=1 Tax=Roseateles sp. DAIF2 TaxID=2714952 RepID=UPI0018A302B3|nr:histidine phosphatase family protein [Roseateles sp. DAIF2]QPF75201.1 histidine phosphatase family protein [Roseateles sp. DAIF2]
MGMLHLVRHGQASFGADDYDQLSALGERQCRLLGEYWRARGQPPRFDAVLLGSLRRHGQSLAAIAEGLGSGLPEPLVWEGLNEYDSGAVIAAIHPEPLEKPRDAEAAKQHFRLLRQGLLAWMRAETAPAGMPSYADFAAGVAGALTHVRERCSGEVLIVSSGGPIATALAQVLGAPPETGIELNLRIRNSAISEVVFNARQFTLQSFNTLPHLDTAETRPLQSYA